MSGQYSMAFSSNFLSWAFLFEARMLKAGNRLAKLLLFGEIEVKLDLKASRALSRRASKVGVSVNRYRMCELNSEDLLYSNWKYSPRLLAYFTTLKSESKSIETS